MSGKCFRLGFAFFALLLTLVHAAAASPLNGETRSYLPLGESACFEVDVPAPGTLLVEVTSSESAARLDAGITKKGTDRVLVRRAGGAVLELSAAGRRAFCVRAQDVAERLGAVRWTSAYVEHELGNGSLLKGDEEDEPDPDPLAPDTQGWGDACDQARRDDHADALACARAVGIGTLVAGELANGWGDDIDVLAFNVLGLQTVTLAARGDGSLRVELLDRHGYLLHAGEQGADGSVRFSRTLVPGPYYVRLVGEGGWELELTGER